MGKIIKCILFWLVSLTWGAIMTYLGMLLAIFAIVLGHRPKRFHYNICFALGDNWGGINFGAFFFVSRNTLRSTYAHEAGHGIQNIVLGPLFPILVGLPSLTRSMYRNMLVKAKIKSKDDLPPYDSIWFERQATEIGNKYFG
jgi:hypothetical protein